MDFISVLVALLLPPAMLGVVMGMARYEDFVLPLPPVPDPADPPQDQGGAAPNPAGDVLTPAEAVPGPADVVPAPADPVLTRADAVLDPADSVPAPAEPGDTVLDSPEAPEAA
ncbi:hypothetical protein ACFPM3_07200 [Streptomyces coeruleoprunus]|uniref:Secreted protein n=1 Tax=Streptomyces coeruleoprunus TaxID=285563 RepID=A0ABV9XCB1_9ACTN